MKQVELSVLACAVRDTIVPLATSSIHPSIHQTGEQLSMEPQLCAGTLLSQIGMPIRKGFGAKLAWDREANPNSVGKKADRRFHALGAGLCNPGPGRESRRPRLGGQSL